MDVSCIGEKTGIYLLENFLSTLECSLLIRHAKKKGLEEDCEEPCKYVRLKSEIPFLNKIHQRLDTLTKIPAENGEQILIVCYGPDSNCHPHNDYRPYQKDDACSGRVAQILFFLNDVEDGGETHFTNLDIKVPAKKRHAIFWFGIENVFLPTQDCEKCIFPEELKDNIFAHHRSVPIKSGKQWVAVKFFHVDNIVTQ